MTEPEWVALAIVGASALIRHSLEKLSKQLDGLTTATNELRTSVENGLWHNSGGLDQPILPLIHSELCGLSVEVNNLTNPPQPRNPA